MKRFPGLIWLLLAGFVVPGTRLPAQEMQAESLTVTAIEVPVRVLLSRQFLSGLLKDDFEIFENGDRQVITGFEEVSRTIAADPAALSGAPAPARPRRYFILIFNIFSYTDQIGEAIDYFFKNIYRPEDRLAVMVEDRLLDVGAGPGTADPAAELKKILSKIKQISSFEFQRTFREMEMESDMLYRTLTLRPNAVSEEMLNDIKRFYFRYTRLWEEYRKRLLDIDMDLYKAVVRKVGRLAGEKWAICFQQRNMFPVLKTQGRVESELERLFGQLVEPQQQVRARDIQADAESLRRKLDFTQGFPADKLRDLFTSANITFHVLMLKSVNRPGVSDSQDLDLRDVQGEYEDTLRKISASTGGITVFSNAVLEILKQAAAKEDRYYLLAYQPSNKKSGAKRNIDVRCRRTGVEVIALKSYVGPNAPSIEISGFTARGRKLGFDIAKYGRSVKNWKEVGQVLIKITVFDAESRKVFEDSRGLQLGKASAHIDLELKKLAAGDHFLIIEAVDLVTGNKDVFSRPIAF